MKRLTTPKAIANSPEWAAYRMTNLIKYATAQFVAAWEMVNSESIINALG
jgi:hypothetical protein